MKKVQRRKGFQKDEATKLPIQCVRCGAKQTTKPGKDGTPKLPFGWKRDKDDRPVCKECWHGDVLLRALTFPVAEPISGTWKELWADLKVAWEQTTAASNWIVTECFGRDVRRNGETEMPKWNKPYLYPELVKLFPDLPAATVAALEQSVSKKYSAKRFEVIWTNASSLPSFRYPQPYPIRADVWEFWFDEEKRPTISATINHHKRTLRLKGGPRYRRHLTGLRHMDKKAELAIYEQTVNGHPAIMCKLVGWIKRRPTKEGTGTLYVRTCSDRLLAAEVLNGDIGRIGIYKITGPTNKVYVGQSINIESRWQQHIADMKKGNHHNEPINVDFAKYGLDAFKFEIIEETLSLDERELYWITKFNAHINGYNHQSEFDRLSGKDPVNYRGSEDHRQVWAENCDHIKRLIGQHKDRNQRLSEDRKAEMNSNKGFRQVRAEYRTKYGNRMKSAVQEIASHLGKFAERCHYARVMYDDAVRWNSADEKIGFQYFALELAIKTKLDELGIDFVKKPASAQVEQKSPEPLAMEEEYVF